MKSIKIICLGLLVSFLAISCKETSKSDKATEAKIVQSENLKKIEVGIEGMTCQIGCAKTIESKLSKMEGISSVAVSFDNKLGQIVYDADKISEEDITKKITSIAGGETYSVSSVKEVSTSSKDAKTCAKKCSDQKMACCSADLKTCTMKCSETCTKADCDKCAAVQADCKKKCATEKQACCAKEIKSCAKKCSESCTKADCEKCAAAKAACQTKCATKKEACKAACESKK